MNDNKMPLAGDVLSPPKVCCEHHRKQSLKNEQPPYYRLRELIADKYGADETRIALGCQIVARFVGFGSKYKWTPARVLAMCVTTTSMNADAADMQKLMSLFKLKMPDELFNCENVEA